MKKGRISNGPETATSPALLTTTYIPPQVGLEILLPWIRAQYLNMSYLSQFLPVSEHILISTVCQGLWQALRYKDEDLSHQQYVS